VPCFCIYVLLTECIAHLAVARDIWSALIINAGLGQSYTPTWYIILLYVMLGWQRVDLEKFSPLYLTFDEYYNTINSIFGDIEINMWKWK